MNHRVACLVVAGLAVACEAPPVTASEPPSVEILVGSVPQTRYAHLGRWYIEAVKGREYAIQLRNPFGVRVAVALSVDGLNTIDARQTSAADARKWVLDPYETVTIRVGRPAAQRPVASSSRPRNVPTARPSRRRATSASSARCSSRNACPRSEPLRNRRACRRPRRNRLRPAAMP